MDVPPSLPTSQRESSPIGTFFVRAPSPPPPCCGSYKSSVLPQLLSPSPPFPKLVANHQVSLIQSPPSLSDVLTSLLPPIHNHGSCLRHPSPRSLQQLNCPLPQCWPTRLGINPSYSSQNVFLKQNWYSSA